MDNKFYIYVKSLTSMAKWGPGGGGGGGGGPVGGGGPKWGGVDTINLHRTS